MKHHAGISLIELTIVLLAIIIICSLTVPKLTFLNRFIAKAELEKLHALCICLQTKAIATQQEQTLTFDKTSHSYQAEHIHEQFPSGIQFGVKDSLLGPPSHPKQLIKQPITFTRNQLIFYPTGLLSAGSLYVTDQSKLFVFALTSPVANQGMLYLYQFMNSRWKQIS